MKRFCARSLPTLVACTALLAAVAAVADVGSSDSPTATLDVRAPELVLIQAPAAGVYRAGDELVLRWSLAEDHLSQQAGSHVLRFARNGAVLDETPFPATNGEHLAVWTVPELSLGDVYATVAVVDAFGNAASFETDRFILLASTTGADLPRAAARLETTPNPFNPSTRIDLSVPNAGPLRLAAYDLLGRRVRTLFHGEAPAGVRTLDWDGRDDAGRALPAGTYVLRMDATGSTLNRKVVLLP